MSTGIVAVMVVAIVAVIAIGALILRRAKKT